MFKLIDKNAPPRKVKITRPVWLNRKDGERYLAQPGEVVSLDAITVGDILAAIAGPTWTDGFALAAPGEARKGLPASGRKFQLPEGACRAPPAHRISPGTVRGPSGCARACDGPD